MNKYIHVYFTFDKNTDVTSVVSLLYDKLHCTKIIIDRIDNDHIITAEFDEKLFKLYYGLLISNDNLISIDILDTSEYVFENVRITHLYTRQKILKKLL
jgi:hypothetical protein